MDQTRPHARSLDPRVEATVILARQRPSRLLRTAEAVDRHLLTALTIITAGLWGYVLITALHIAASPFVPQS